MALVICPNCHASNQASRERCENCGLTLDKRQIVLRRESRLTIGGRALPAAQLKAIGASLAVSVVALLAEAGLIWLRRRVQVMENSPLPNGRERRFPLIVPQEPAGKPAPRVVTLYGERIVEERRWGRPARRIIERFAWRSETPDGE